MIAVGDHLAAAGEFFAKPLHAPRGNDANARIEGLGGKLEPALVVPLARGSVGIVIGPNLPGHLQADLGDQWPGDRSAQQVRPLVLGVPKEDGEGKIAAQFVPGIDNAGRLGPNPLRLLENRLPVLARLAEIDVHGMDVVAFLAEPAQDDRGIQSARIRQNAACHESSVRE